MSNAFLVPETKCFSCGQPNDAATNVLGKDGPDAGDVTICMYCGALAIFNADKTLRELTGKELIEVMKDPRVQQIERARQYAMKGSAKSWPL